MWNLPTKCIHEMAFSLKLGMGSTKYYNGHWYTCGSPIPFVYNCSAIIYNPKQLTNGIGSPHVYQCPLSCSVAILGFEILDLVKAKYFFGLKIPCPMKYSFGETVTLEKCLVSGKKII